MPVCRGLSPKFPAPPEGLFFEAAHLTPDLSPIRSLFISTYSPNKYPSKTNHKTSPPSHPLNQRNETLRKRSTKAKPRLQPRCSSPPFWASSSPPWPPRPCSPLRPKSTKVPIRPTSALTTLIALSPNITRLARIIRPRAVSITTGPSPQRRFPDIIRRARTEHRAVARWRQGSGCCFS